MTWLCQLCTPMCSTLNTPLALATPSKALAAQPTPPRAPLLPPTPPLAPSNPPPTYLYPQDEMAHWRPSSAPVWVHSKKRADKYSGWSVGNSLPMDYPTSRWGHGGAQWVADRTNREFNA